MTLKTTQKFGTNSVPYPVRDAAPGGLSRSTSCCCCWLTDEMLRGASSPCRDYLTETREEGTWKNGKQKKEKKIRSPGEGSARQLVCAGRTV